MAIFRQLVNILRRSNKWKPLNHSYKHPKYDGGNFEEWLISGIKGFKQWYQPVIFTEEIKASVTVPPSWTPNSELDYEWGLGRWNDLILPNLPQISGKRILDLGCSSGLYSIEMCEHGAKEVIGIDRDDTFTQKSSPLPPQSVIDQANFVKEAIQIIRKKQYPIKYIACDFSDYEKLMSLGEFDFILALNVVYHELEGTPKLLNTLAQMTNNLILQASQGHGEKIAYWANLPKQLELLLQAGFTKVEVIAPKDYLDPMIIATK